MIVNGTDLSTVGFRLQTRRLPGIGGERSVFASLPGAIGAARLGGSVPHGTMGVSGYVKGDDRADLVAKIDSLVALLRGELVVRFDDFPDREWVGRLQEASGLEAIGPAEATTFEDVRLEIGLPTPTARARAETVLAASAALGLGTAPSPLRIEIDNGATSPITQVIVRIRAGGAAGAVLRELTWDGNLAVGQQLVVDGETFTVTNAGANGLGGITAASEFPIADPDEGADYVEVAVTGGGGADAKAIRFRERWYR